MIDNSIVEPTSVTVVEDANVNPLGKIENSPTLMENPSVNSAIEGTTLANTVLGATLTGTTLGTTLGTALGTTLGTTLGGTTLGGAGSSSIKPLSTLGGTIGQNPPNPSGRKKQLQQLPKATGKFVIKAHRDSELDHVSSDEEEDEKDYKTGGYCPVTIGMSLNKRYEIQKKLGWGHFSTVWLCNDIEKNGHVAIKILKSAKNYREAALDEIHILTTIKQADSNNVHCILLLLDNFEVQSQFGRHIAMVFEKLGCNLLMLIRIYKYRCIPIPLVKIIAKQMLVAIAFLHKCQIIHTDLKPENLMLVNTPDFVRHLAKYADEENDKERTTGIERNEITPEEGTKDLSAGDSKSSEKIPKKFVPPRTDDELREVFGKNDMWKLKVVDLGNACWVFKHFSTDVQTREYRAPEVILGASYGTPIDIWSAACIVFELLTGDQLFKPKESRHFGKDDDHLALIIELLGEQKIKHLIIGKYGKHFFDPNGDLKNIKKLKYWPLQQVLVLLIRSEKYKLPAKDAKEISDFLFPMLYFNSQKRHTAVKCLQHPWISNVDVNNFDSIFSDETK